MFMSSLILACEAAVEILIFFFSNLFSFEYCSMLRLTLGDPGYSPVIL